MDSREGAPENARKNQQAPGRLEVLRAFLNTWRIPNDTRVPTDHLQTDEDVRAFRDTYFSSEIVAEPKEELVRLREDLRDHLGSAEAEFLNRWLEKYPVTVRIGNNRVHYGGDGRLCGELLALAVEAVSEGCWERFKACPDCRWVFFDNTRNKSKVWCGMNAYGPEGRACGTIAKVNRWRQKQKQRQ
jgi:predicted RNA-binding Zn ribbon-like protein